jgi:DNA-3-methyladenine glycosylase
LPCKLDQVKTSADLVTIYFLLLNSLMLSYNGLKMNRDMLDKPIKRLTRPFFERPTLLVAEELIGKVLIFKEHIGIITETEAYVGFNDPASHAFRGETPRTKIMFGKAGFSYVYLIYGMYHCLNIVTEKAGFPAGVLIRGVKLLNEPKLHLDGPGKICRHMGITKAHYGIDVTTSEELYLGCTKKTLKFTKTPRIGIKVATDRLWRFLAKPDK